MNFEGQLLGHDNPLGRYPAPVVPIVITGFRLVAVHTGNDGEPQLTDIPFDKKFIWHKDEVTQQLSNFDYRRHRLFALSEQELEIYSSVDQRAYFEWALSNAEFSRENPFLRLSLAKATGITALLLDELYGCVVHLLRNTNEEFIDHWYATERVIVLERIDPTDSYRVPPNWKVLLRVQQAKRPVIARPGNQFLTRSTVVGIGGTGAAMGLGLVVVAMFDNRLKAERAYQLLLKRNYDPSDVHVLLLQETFNSWFPELQTEHLEPEVEEHSLSRLLRSHERAKLGETEIVYTGRYAKNFGGIAADQDLADIVKGLTAAGLSEERARVLEAGLKDGGILIGVSSVPDYDTSYFENDWQKI